MGTNETTEAVDPELGAILFRCGKRSMDEYMTNVFGFPLFVSVFVYLKVSFLGVVFIGAPIVIGLDKLGSPTEVNLVLLVFFAFCSFGYFGYSLYIAPERLKFFVCERGILFRKGHAVHECRVFYDQIDHLQLGDDKRGKKLHRTKHRMRLRIERQGDKPIHINAFTARFKRKSIDTMLTLMEEISGFTVTRGNVQYNRR